MATTMDTALSMGGSLTASTAQGSAPGTGTQTPSAGGYWQQRQAQRQAGQQPAWKTNRPGNNAQPTNGQPQGQPQTSTAQPQQTFAQLQQQGLARPAPPSAPAPQQAGSYQQDANQQQFTGQLQGAVSNALQNPGAYNTGQVQQVQQALTNSLNQQFQTQRNQLQDQMASRGLLSSSIASGYEGDLATNQANALANMNAQLIQNAAQLTQQGQATALQAGQGLQSNLANQGLAGYQANLAGLQANNQNNLAQAQFNQGQYQNAAQLALGAGQAAGQLGLGQQQQNLAQQLGLGNLGVSQQQANTAQAAQQAQAQYQSGQLGLGQQAQDLASKVQTGQLSIAQAQQQLQQQVQTGQLSIAQANQQLAQLQNSQQFGLQGQQLALQSQLGLGNLALNQAQLAQQGSQFGQSLQAQIAQNQAQNALQAGQLTGTFGGAQTLGAQQLAAQQSQFGQSLAQQLGLAQMQNTTQNRQIGVGQQLGQENAITQLLSILGGPTGSGLTSGNGSVLMQGIMQQLGLTPSNGVPSNPNGVNLNGFGYGNNGNGSGGGSTVNPAITQNDPLGLALGGNSNALAGQNLFGNAFDYLNKLNGGSYPAADPSQIPGFATGG